MLQSVRKYTKGWVATIMGFILSFAMVLWGIENYIGGSKKKTVVAKVNGQEITSSEVANDIQRMIVRLKEQAGASFSLPPTMQLQLQKEALNNLIIENVLTQSALKGGFRVTTQEAVAMVKQMPAFQDEGRFSKQRFEQIINKLGYTQQEFIADVSHTLLLNQIASGIIGTAFVLPDEAIQAIALMEQKRDIEYTIISSNAIKKKNPITEEQVNTYYSTHRSQYRTPAKVQLEYVLLSANDLKKNIQVSDQDVKEYLDSNSDLDKKNPEAIKKAKETVQQQKLEQAFLAASDKLTDLTYTTPNSLNEAANSLGLKVNTSEYFTREGGNNPITKNAKIISNAFDTGILKDRINSNLIEISPGVVAVIRVKDYQAEGEAPLSDVKEKIRQDLAEKEASVKTKQKGDALVSNVKSKNDYSEIISSEHLSSISKAEVSRNSKNINPEILQLAFSVMNKPVVGMQLSNGDYAILITLGCISFTATSLFQRPNTDECLPDR